jgi:hypothetical protein
MTQKRIRELGQIAAHLYNDVLDNMGTHKYGHVSGGIEEVIVLSELVAIMQRDLHDWTIDELRNKDELMNKEEK